MDKERDDGVMFMDIQINNLTKDYGKFRALDDVSLRIGHGMFGLLGPNGAGKSTLMKILTTLALPTSGDVQIDGISVRQQPEYVRQRLGYVPQSFGFYKSLNAYALLDYIGTMKNIPRSERKRQIEKLLEQVNLTADAKRRVGNYSGGMKQRLGIVQALMGDPPLLVVDEPTAGLDTEERIRFRNLLTRLSGERTVILSTHIVADIEVSCTGVAVLNKGRLAFNGVPDALIDYARGRVWQMEIAPSEWDKVEAQFRVINSRSLSDRRLLVRLIADENPLGRSEPVEPGLEDGYVATIQGKTVAYA